MTDSEEQTQSLSQYGKLLDALSTARVDYAVVGGLAVIFNGYPRLTLDADIIVDESPANLERMLAVLRAWGEGWARELSIADFTPEEGAVRLGEDFELDIFTRLRGLGWKDFQPRMRFIEHGTARIPYLSPEDLIHCKANSRREKDQLDVIALTKIIQQEKTAQP
ncbi:DUF6036 family nucleotidyltransferase [Prosthecobacter sp.]|uniref:DUF6036 family nucleotidyltransferase n=1 Tax=Prosthecobacter sp. TaxID=1965333 RepID=UPI002ABAD8F4|nr:DUF6036 family nucleotidyltransferase [Prosthecobacter sp.]MDZ4401528.1 DUF6036 family nucleotidyltransferase [Prosthecobacter sp.]